MLLPLQWYPCYAYTDCNKRHRFSYPSKIHVQLQNLSSLLRQRSYSVFFPIMFRLCVTHEIHSRHTVSPISFQLSSDEKMRCLYPSISDTRISISTFLSCQSASLCISWFCCIPLLSIISVCHYIFHKCIWTHISRKVRNNHTDTGCHKLIIHFTNDKMMVIIIYNIIPSISQFLRILRNIRLM